MTRDERVRLQGCETPWFSASCLRLLRALDVHAHTSRKTIHQLCLLVMPVGRTLSRPMERDQRLRAFVSVDTLELAGVDPPACVDLTIDDQIDRIRTHDRSAVEAKPAIEAKVRGRIHDGSQSHDRIRTTVEAKPRSETAIEGEGAGSESTMEAKATTESEPTVEAKAASAKAASAEAARPKPPGRSRLW